MARALWYDDTATGGSEFPISEEFDNIDFDDNGTVHSNLSTVWYNGGVSTKMIWAKFKTFVYPGPVPVNPDGTNPYNGDIGEWLNDYRVNPSGPGNVENVKIVIAAGTRVSSLNFGINIPLRYTIEFHNYGEIQGTNTGSTAITLSKPIIMKNYGWIRAAGGRGGNGGAGGRGGNGSKGGNGGAGGAGGTSGSKSTTVQTGTNSWSEISRHFDQGRHGTLPNTNLGGGWYVSGRPGVVYINASPCGSTWSGWNKSGFTMCGVTVKAWHEYHNNGCCRSSDENYYFYMAAGSIPVYGNVSIQGCGGGSGGAGGITTAKAGAGGAGGSAGAGGWGQSFLSPTAPRDGYLGTAGAAGGSGAASVSGSGGSVGCRTSYSAINGTFYGYRGGTGGHGGQSGITTAGGSGGRGGNGGRGGTWGQLGDKGVAGSSGSWAINTTATSGSAGNRGGNSEDGRTGVNGSGGSVGSARTSPTSGGGVGGVGYPGKAIIGTRQFLSGSIAGSYNGELVY